MAENANRLHDVVKIIERLAHSHEDDVADLLPLLVFSQDPICSINFAEDFCNREIALEALVPGCAEHTAHGAANLAGDAEGVALLAEIAAIAHEHTFDQRAVGQLHEIFFCAVLGNKALLQHRIDQLVAIQRQRLEQFFTDIVRLLKISDLLIVQPRKKLFGAEGWLADLQQIFL